ncbi:hypothetical protein GLOIN_2v1768727 [Rhizophagus irregularis DAOM 181602=DAOM 197198]|nr:hypothetical protein GLOIN_2v1768727 [Rhizophagus irregularis DAOM 181602=DAOM 197198]
MYENYFTKRPTQADPHFYLKPCNISEVEFNGQWYHKQHVSEKEIKSFMKKIVTLTRINVDDRKISNHSEESMEQSTLSTDNFVVAKSLLNDNREVINSANT